MDQISNSTSYVGSVGVFCGAANGNAPEFTQFGFQVGELLGRLNLRLVYGGARHGMMGAVANGTLARGGQVLGVLPKCLDRVEIPHREIQTLERTVTLSERKARMFEESDLFLILPGGVGTLDELFEVITHNQLGIFSKCCLIFNFAGFYTPLLNCLELMAYAGFARPLGDYFLVVHTLEELESFLLSSGCTP